MNTRYTDHHIWSFTTPLWVKIWVWMCWILTILMLTGAFMGLFGCAADPPAPIEFYRQQYGFAPVR